MSQNTIFLKKRLSEAEFKAKKNRTDVNLDIVNQEDKKANELGMQLVRKKNVNRTKFTQNIIENIQYLDEKQYLTSAEFGFIFKLSPLLEMGTNAIVNQKTGQYFTVSELAARFKRSRQKTSEIISILIEKGIIYEFVNAREIRDYGRSVTKRPFFLNPEIICAGDKNKLEGGLIRLMIHYNILEKKGVRLPIKASSLPHATYGKLVTRKTFLSLHKTRKK